MGEVGPGACARFLVGGSGSCPLVGEAVSCPSGGKGHVKGCALGWLWAQYDFKQPVCWWVGYVPVLLVVCPEVLQNWSLQAVGWGRVFMLKWGPLGELTLIGIPWGLCYQCPCSHSELHSTPASPGDPPKPLGKSSPGSYGVTALCWVPVHVRPWVHLQEWMRQRHSLSLG